VCVVCVCCVWVCITSQIRLILITNWQFMSDCNNIFVHNFFLSISIATHIIERIHIIVFFTFSIHFCDLVIYLNTYHIIYFFIILIFNCSCRQLFFFCQLFLALRNSKKNIFCFTNSFILCYLLQIRFQTGVFKYFSFVFDLHFTFFFLFFFCSNNN